MLRRLFSVDLLCSKHPNGFEAECEGCRALRRADVSFTALDDQRAQVMKDLVEALQKRIIVVAGMK